MRVLVWATCCFLVVGALPPFINPGTPKNIPPSFDCAVRKAAWEYGKSLLPHRGSFRTLYDALQLQACGVPTPSVVDVWTPPTYASPTGTVVFVSSTNGSDSNPGTESHPFATIAHAVHAVKGSAATVLLRAGAYHTDTIEITPDHSGLTIQNFNGERAVISGGVPVPITKSEWKPYRMTPAKWLMYPNQNNVYGKAKSREDTPTIKYIGTLKNVSQCQQGVLASSKGPFHSYTFHEPSFGGDFAGQCFGVTTDMWSPTPEDKIISARLREAQNTWVADIAHVGLRTIPGLRKDGERSIRAKFPNGNPELSGEWFVTTNPGMGGGDYTNGWITSATDWVKPARKADSTEIVITGKDWPSVNWPMSQEGGSRWTGEGDWGEYHLGMGGYCDDLDPPYGYWCAMHPPRGQCFNNKTMSSSGCVQTHMSPDGVVARGHLPNLPNYTDPTGAVVQAWRGGGRWYTNLCLVSGWDKATGTLYFDKKIGCNQGGEGEVSANQWWIENVKEECDSAEEYYYDEKEKKLYYNFNGTSQPTGQEKWVATKTQVLFNITGTQQNPVRHVTVRGVVMRDTAYTYLGTTKASVHSMPSGGDWALQRSGAVLIEGGEFVTIGDSLLTRIDGNGVFVSNYNRNVTISNNEMSWVGDSAMAAWGSTGHCLTESCDQKVPYKVGPDGRGGDQPRGTTVSGNLVREIGIWEKQSSMWFQAVTAQTHLVGNVHFNGPRAGLNFNDGFGGGDIIEHNLLLNCVRESGDHGPWNSWDRVPYVTDIGMIRDPTQPSGHRPANGKPSVVPTFRQVRKNFIVGTYSSQEDMDTDDGSSYYHTYNNFFVYAVNGLKSDFGGQWHHHYANVYAYVDNCFGTGNNLAFYNNSCVTWTGYKSDCHVPSTMTVNHNAVFTQGGTLNACGTTLPKWVAEGHDKGTTLAKWPTDSELIHMGERVLQ